MPDQPSNEANILERYNYQTVPFPLCTIFRSIVDTVAFIKALKSNCHIYEHSHRETINYFKQIKLYGSNKSYYLVEIDFHNGSSCEYPWKRQFVFTTSGKLLKILNEIKFELVKIFPNQGPFLFGVSSTGHGNGWHEVYRIKRDTLEQVYDGLQGNHPSTYDVNQDLSVNEPAAFDHLIKDVNHDGYNDIVLYGKIVLIEGRTKKGYLYNSEVKDGKIIASYSVDHPFKKIPIRMFFLYHPLNGHFIEQRDYSKEYSYIFRDG